MKNFTRYALCYALTILLFTQCNRTPDEVSIFDDGMTELFLTDIDDQRCPNNVTCVSAGNARLSLRVEVDSESADIILDTSDGIIGTEVFRSDTMILGATIELLGLDPLPDEGETLEIDEYDVDIRVTY